jgi:hypothetical protein
MFVENLDDDARTRFDRDIFAPLPGRRTRVTQREIDEEMALFRTLGSEVS